MALQNRFSEDDQNRIKAAVKLAEDKISGEIVPVFVEQSGFYTLAHYRAAMIGAVLAFMFVVIFDRLMPDWAVYDPLYIFVIVVFGSILGGVLPQFIVPLKRFLTGQKHFDRATRNKAENAFLEEEVFNTRHRTGIMIFISSASHLNCEATNSSHGECATLEKSLKYLIEEIASIKTNGNDDATERKSSSWQVFFIFCRQLI